MLLRWLKQNNDTSVIGIEIGTISVKMLEIQQTEVSSETSYLVNHFVVAPIPEGAIVKDEVKDADAISKILKDMYRQADIKTKNVAIAIPRSAVSIKNTTVDSRLTTSEIESRAWIEANRQFPELVGEIYLDFNIIGTSKQDNTQLEMMLVACRKEQIKPYLDIIRHAGLEPKIVDVDSYAFHRSLSLIQNQFPQLENVALLNLNNTLSSLIVTQKQELIYAHDQSYDGRRLLTQTREYLNKSGAEHGTISDAPYLEILKENLISHLRHTMHFFYSSRPNISIQKLVVSGDCASIPDLSLFIQQETGIETILANPFKNMVCSQNVNQTELERLASSLMLSCGLALSKLK